MNLKKAAVFLTSIIFIFSCFSLGVYADDGLLAFPGAEGGGKYATGARGADNIEVYHVTNLNESGSGSFADAVSRSGRIIVFDVGGTIWLDNTLTISRDNLTILGQTAPGDGITFAGSDILLASGASNIIMRYLRIRPTDINGGEPDGLGGRWNHNVIIDHCSVSWSVDEGLTLYAGSSESRTQGSNLTIQNTIGAESLKMSNHFKGAHGYGAIWGGTDSSYHHNLLAHHDSRSPRLDRELRGTDIRNNVVYDWGITNSAYGAEPYSYNSKTYNPSNVNWVNNYYKHGPSTASKLFGRLFEVSNNENRSKSNFYFAGNYVFENEAVTNDNLSGVYKSELGNMLSEPIDMGEYALPEQSAEDAYEEVLSDAGATLPRRDSIDARIVADVKNGTGRIVNNANETGGLIEMEETSRVFEIPEDWKNANSMGSASETDIVESGEWAGYTWIEAYVNDWTESQDAPSNPDIVVTSPAIASLSDEINGYAVDNGNWAVISDNEELNYSAVGIPVDGTEITKMELYDGNELIRTYEGASEIDDNITLEAGTHYLTSRAYNNEGESTGSPTSIVYVKNSNEAEGYTHTQIGTPSFDGEGGAGMEDNGVYDIFGSGKIGRKNDSCDFMYKTVTGDFDISAEMVEIAKFENGQISGLMLRESLDPDSRMAMLADGWLKYGENVRVLYRAETGENAEDDLFFKNERGGTIDNDGGYDTSKDEYRVPKYMRIQRVGDRITFYVSDDGKDWTNNPRQPQSVTIEGLADTLYVGIAVDSAEGTPTKDYMAEVKYGDIDFEGTEAAPPTAAPTPTATPAATPTAAPTATPIPTATPTPSATAAPTATAPPTPSPTATPIPTAAPTATPTATPGFSDEWSIVGYNDGELAIAAPENAETGGVNSALIASYGDDGMLLDCEVVRFAVESGKAEYRLEVRELRDFGDIRIMLWNEKMQPLTKPFSV